MSSVPEKMGAEYYRGLLTAQGKTLYDRICGQLLKEDYSGILSFPVSCALTAASDCFAAYKAVRDDHPEYFYLGFQSECILWERRGCLKYSVLYSKEKIRRIQYQLRECICRLVRGTAYLPELEREVLVYRRIAGELTYINHNSIQDHSIVGPVLFSSGVCEGYNALLLLCLRRVGIPCIKVYGRTRSDTRHCWTIAWIEGQAVHCDVTWDGMANKFRRFRYLNLSDRQIAVDHSGFQGEQIPRCRPGKRLKRKEMKQCISPLSEIREAES